jgi:DNA-binding transcriptional LysR family regulator
VDIGLALGPVRLKNAWSSKIARVRQVLCASPQYIANSGDLSGLDDLTAHPSIVDESVKHLAMLTLVQGDSHLRTRIYIRYTVPSLLEARQAAIAGLGIACLPLFMCDQQLRAGQLAVLLPDYEPVARDLFLIAPKAAIQKRNPTALRLYLESALGNRLL